MRIDSLPDISAAIRTNVADLLGRLDTGDVIQARVLDVKSSEVVLRLFDGSVLKAQAEGLDAKVGQTLTLAVSSKAEGTLYLETVKDPSEPNNANPNILKNVLKSIQIATSTQNLELAAEFIKADVTVTVDLMDKAAGLMNSFKGLDAEKAVFIASKDLLTDPVRLELLAKLLDGNLKLGEQIKDLQAVLGKAQSNALLSKIASNPSESLTAQAGTTSNVISVNTVQERIPASGANIALQEGIGASDAVISQQGGIGASDAGISQQRGLSKTDVVISQSGGMVTSSSDQQITNSSTATVAVGHLDNEGTTATIKLATIGTENPASASSNLPSPEHSTTPTTAAHTSAASSLASAGSTASLPSSVVPLSGLATTSPFAAPSTSTVTSASASAEPETSAALSPSAVSELFVATDPVSINSVNETMNKANNMTVNNSAVSTASDPFVELKDAIDQLFININSDKVASDLDVNNLHKELNNKLEILKTSIQTAELAELAAGEGISVASALIDDSVNLMNQLNNSNMLYYQLPVNLSGYHTTAELYVMKRQSNKKRIDPHDTVMFVSLDTNNLGRIETLLDVKGNNVTINLRTEKSQINDFVKENIKYLYTGMAACGYRLVDIRYALIDSPASPLKQERLLSKMIDPSHTKVDMRI